MPHIHASLLSARTQEGCGGPPLVRASQPRAGTEEGAFPGGSTAADGQEHCPAREETTAANSEQRPCSTFG